MKRVELVKAMGRSGMIPFDLAQKAGLTKATISKIINCKTQGSPKSWEAIASVLNVDIEVLKEVQPND